MKTIDPKERLLAYCKIADVHAKRLTTAVLKTQALLPLSTSTLESITDENLGYLEILSSRFSKLQDTIGSKIFVYFMQVLKEEEKTVIDRLNKLEKLEFLDSAEWWDSLRGLRNEFTHDYPEDPAEIPEQLEKLVKASQELLTFWVKLKPKLEIYL